MIDENLGVEEFFIPDSSLLPKPFLALGKIITDDGNPTVIFLDVKIDLEVHCSFFLNLFLR